jgi:hypothetical protein
MTPERLDSIFPYLCFAYGAVMSIALNLPGVARLADEKLPQALAAQWKSHRGLAMICLAVGSLWILQNLWLE